MDAETIHFVLELTVGLITVGLGGLFAYILRMESRVSTLEAQIESFRKELESFSELLTWFTRKREGD